MEFNWKLALHVVAIVAALLCLVATTAAVLLVAFLNDHHDEHTKFATFEPPRHLPVN